MYGSDEQATIAVVGQVDLRPTAQRTRDAGTQAAIRQYALGDVGRQNRVADVRDARPDIVDGQVVGQMTGADDLNAAVQHKQPDRGADEIVPMNQGVDQQFFKHDTGHFGNTWIVNAAPGLDFVEVAHDEGEGVVKYLAQRAGEIFRVQVVVRGNGVAVVANTFNDELGFDRLRMLGEQEDAGEVQEAVRRRQIQVFQEPQAVGSFGIIKLILLFRNCLIMRLYC